MVTPVIDQHGRRSGTVVEWRNVTMEKAIEAEIDEVVKAAVAGDFSRRLPLDGKKEFMLNLATAMNSLCENTANALEDLIAMLSSLAEGDLTARIIADYQGAFGRLKSDANTMAERIGSTIGEIKSSAREVTNASAEISTSTTDLSQRTEEQAASLEQTSASMEAARNHGEEERRASAAGQSVGSRHARCCRSRRAGRRQGGRRHGADRRILAQDFRHHHRDRRDRAANQSPGA